MSSGVRKRVIALVLIAGLFISAFSGLAMAAAKGEWTVSKSKEAVKTLDASFQTDVTLALPAAEEVLVSDIVFVVDKSSCGQEATDQAEAMVSQLLTSIETTKAVIKVGAIVFAGKEYVTFPLAVLDSSNLTKFNDEAFTNPADMLSGTNMHAGLLRAQQMLDDDTEVENSRKYMILISDGLTRLFNKDGKVDGQVLNIYYKHLENEPNYLGELSTWNIVRSGSDSTTYPIPSVPPFDGTWPTYFSKISEWIQTDKDDYADDYLTFKSVAINPASTPKHIPFGEAIEHAMCMDRAIYEAYHTYQSLKSKYNCYAINVKEEYLIGNAFMNALNAGATIDFDAIKNDILYLLSEGSTVLDVIGYGTDDKGNAYDFDFVDNLDSLVLKEGDTALAKTKLSDISAYPNATSVYAFGEMNGGKYPFLLRYYEKGENGASDESFVWEINTSVSKFKRVTLTYKVELTNPQPAQVRDMTYGDLKTNLKATLYPRDSAGGEGSAEDFEVPVVQYMVPGTGLSLTVKKEWVLDDGGKAADSVKAVLLKDGKPFGDPVTLNAANGWTYTWNGLDPDSEWTVDELEVPEGFDKTLREENADALQFVIENNDIKAPVTEPTKPHPVPPSTGENNPLGTGLVWLAIAGVFLAAAVSYRLVKRRQTER